MNWQETIYPRPLWNLTAGMLWRITLLCAQQSAVHPVMQLQCNKVADSDFPEGIHTHDLISIFNFVRIHIFTRGCRIIFTHAAIVGDGCIDLLSDNPITAPCDEKMIPESSWQNDALCKNYFPALSRGFITILIDTWNNGYSFYQRIEEWLSC